MRCGTVPNHRSCSQTFIQTNHDLVLHVPETQGNYELFFWKFNTNNNIIKLNGGKTTLFPKYKDRVKFFQQNFSLILKNVKLNDSGLYSAVKSDEEDETLVMFDVTVEAPVSAVCLRLDSVSSSSDSCNFTVICQTELFSLSRSFTCDTPGCEEPRPQHSGHAHSSPSLNLTMSNTSIICNHSNHVSWTHAVLDYREECEKDGEEAKAPAVSTDERMKN
ncbi:uncharacterized protein [Eucyclogobius newberryi]|uniref:uncharacterized protein n=1 Tax=Eucyclogobius newberryi TaxID=166745 RepID=UPI003B59D1D0